MIQYYHKLNILLGFTALHLAVQRKKQPIVEFLVQSIVSSGATLNEKSNNGKINIMSF